MVSTSKKLSVIIPVYNEEGTVTALLDKVVQAVISTSLEIIIVNDGSTDGSPALIEKWVQEHRKSRAEILYLTKKNGGKGSAVKTGIKASTGDVVITIQPIFLLLVSCFSMLLFLKFIIINAQK